MSKKKWKQLNIGVLGDNETEKDSFIRMYTKYAEHPIKKNEILTIDKMLNNNHLKINFFKVSNKGNKNTDIVSICHVIIILFDLSNRTAFENILDNWLLWLRDDCGFERKISIIGIQKKEGFLATTEKEVAELIKMSKIKAEYSDFSQLEESQQVDYLDKIFTSEEYEDLSYNAGGSLTGGCFIF